MIELYTMIFKRKSIRKFNETLFLTEEELVKIKQETEKLIPLVDDIRVKFELVKRANTTAKRGEYCLLMYSEKKPHYLHNAGYLLEQMDLFLTAYDIGVCWYGLAKAKEIQVDSLDYVIMLAFGKSRPQDFRKDASEFKRKNIKDIWKGNFDSDVVNAVRLAPSACNTQPWRIFNDANHIKVFRNTKIKLFIPTKKLPYYNSIDMGICLCFLEIAMTQKGYGFDRTLIAEENFHAELLEIATYNIK
ncbi:MAG: nitroreductase family protein [Oscillospiraceae bacterium]